MKNSDNNDSIHIFCSFKDLTPTKPKVSKKKKNISSKNLASQEIPSTIPTYDMAIAGSNTETLDLSVPTPTSPPQQSTPTPPSPKDKSFSEAISEVLFVFSFAKTS